MNTRAALVELLHAGLSDRAIARQVHVNTRRVQELRAELGLPPHRPGPKPDSPASLFWKHAQPTPDGHLLWPRSEPRIRSGHEGARQRAGQVAFQIGNGRNPVGKVTTGCDVAGCIHPDHVEDEPMRRQYTAIFGEAAA